MSEIAAAAKWNTGLVSPVNRQARKPALRHPQVAGEGIIRGVIEKAAIADVEVAVCDWVLAHIRFEADGALEPGPRGGIVIDLHEMPADVGDVEVAVRIEFLGAAVFGPRLAAAPDPVEAHAVTQEGVVVVGVEFSALSYQVIACCARSA